MSEARKISQTVLPESTGTRLDVWLATLPEIQTRNQAARLIEKNLVKVSGVLPLKVKASYRLRGDETVEIEIPAPVTSHLPAQDIPLEIIYQDNDIVVVNKPAGLVTHPGAGNSDGTLVNALLFHVKDLSDIGGVERPGLVHRLDKDTSGVIVVAKNNKSHKALAESFLKREMDRVYWAVVAGVPREKEGTIESNLARHPKHRTAYASVRAIKPQGQPPNQFNVQSNDQSNGQLLGKHAVTHYDVIKTFKNQASLLHVRLETGRTHQIRVHLSEMGYPVLGDKLYGVKRQKALVTLPALKKALAKLPRHVLHAAQLGFEHPRTKQQMSFQTEWPEDLESLINELEKIK